MPRKKIDVNPECGNRLWKLLRENGIKQIQLAERLNYDPRHVSSIITGKRRLTPETAYKIARAILKINNSQHNGTRQRNHQQKPGQEQSGLQHPRHWENEPGVFSKQLSP